MRPWWLRASGPGRPRQGRSRRRTSRAPPALDHRGRRPAARRAAHGSSTGRGAGAGQDPARTASASTPAAPAATPAGSAAAREMIRCPRGRVGRLHGDVRRRACDGGDVDREQHAACHRHARCRAGGRGHRVPAQRSPLRGQPRAKQGAATPACSTADVPASAIGARIVPSLLLSSESSVNRSWHMGHCRR